MRGRIGLGRIDVDGEGQLLGGLAVDQSHEVNARFMGVDVPEAPLDRIDLASRTTSPDGRTTSTSGLPASSPAPPFPSGMVTGAPGQSHRPLALRPGQVERQPRQERKKKRLERQVGPVNMQARAQE